MWQPDTQGIIFEPNNAANSILVNIQPNELRRALSNVVNNAMQAINGAGEIKVVVKRTTGKCVILIEDNGKGIPADILPQIGVEGFSYGKSNGSGLGFYNAKRVIESWGGSIEIDSTHKVGTTVRMTLPLAKPPTGLIKNSKNSKAGRRGIRVVPGMEETHSDVVKGLVQ